MNLSKSSHDNNSQLRTPVLEAHTRIILWSILLVWSLLGNVLVIAVVYCNQNLRTNMNYLIVNMAVSDLLISLVTLPTRISSLAVRPGEWFVEGHLGEALCKLVNFLSNVSPYVSSISLVIITYQRYIAIVYPARRQILTSKKVWILIFFPWIVAMALFSPYLYISRLTKRSGYTMCRNSWPTVIRPMIFLSTIAIVGFVIPLIAITIMYTIIQYKLRKSLHSVKEMIERETIRSRQRRHRRIFYMTLTIIAVFTIGWLPLGVLHFLSISHQPLVKSMDFRTSSIITFTFIYLWYSLAAVNPCIYFLFLRDFRQGLKIIHCRKPAPANEQTYTLSALCVGQVNLAAIDGDGSNDHLSSIPL